MTDPYAENDIYTCDICDQPVQDDDRHDDNDGWWHADCCPKCN